MIQKSKIFMESYLKIVLIKSIIGRSKSQRLILKSLKLRKINQIVKVKNTSEILGMLNKINHMIKIIKN